MKPKPFLRLLPLICAILLSQAVSFAVPARKGIINLLQPDGTVIQAILSGDEHGHLTTTLDGCAITQDEEGWWCYTRYDYYGHRLNTGEHVGDPDTPGDVIAASRNIPYDLLRRQRISHVQRAQPFRAREMARTRSFAADGSGSRVRHGLIILAQFEDLEFRYGRDQFVELINGSSATSALSYFKDQWKDACSFKFDISEIVSLPHDYAYYGANNDNDEDDKAAEMIADACKAVGSYINFSDYDNDGDGKVDNVFVFYAGPNEAEGAGENYVWPHQWSLIANDIYCRRDGVLVDNYACTSELQRDNNGTTSFATIGTFCHEYTHTFGIPDLYDTDEGGSGGYSEGMWSCIDLMDAGNYNNDGRTPPGYSALEHWCFGISEGVELTKGSHTLRPLADGGKYYYMKTDDEKEIFLFECRRNRGWDAYIGGNGLLIYHIDESDRDAGGSSTVGENVTASDRWSLNELNARPERQCADLIEPDTGARQRFQSVSGDLNAIRALASHAFWPYHQTFNDVDIYTCDTDPAFQFWSGAGSPLGIMDIQVKSDGSVTFTVFDDQAEKVPAVKFDNRADFQDAVIIQWSSVDPAFTGNGVIRYGLADATNLTEVEVEPYENGKFAYVIDGLKPTTAYKAQLLCRKNGIPGPVYTDTFTTKSDKKADSYPYIYLKGIERGSGGTFAPDTPIPLRVYNAPDADGVSWYFNGSPISPWKDGYYHLTRSGELKAVISYPSGSTETIIKKIVVE